MAFVSKPRLTDLQVKIPYLKPLTIYFQNVHL